MAPILKAKSLRSDPPMGKYYVFHHIDNGKDALKTYRTLSSPEIKGAFVHFTSDMGEEVWLSGNITIRKLIIS
jgi:hypothetical protein